HFGLACNLDITQGHGDFLLCRRIVWWATRLGPARNDVRIAPPTPAIGQTWELRVKCRGHALPTAVFQVQQEKRRSHMGRIFEVRKHTMFARWNRMAKQFARIGKDITIAVKAGGPDPASNPALRRIIQNAKSVNMPKDKVEAAIRRASGKEAANYTEILYEGYAPHGVAVLVEAATDNPTRTVASVRNIFSRSGGNLGASNSVSFQFRKMGVFRLNPEGVDQDDLELYLIDHGLDEMGESVGEKGEPQLVIRCAFADFGQLQKALEERGITPLSAEHEYICITPTELPEEQATEVMEMIDKLEQDEDVQKVYHTLA